PWEKPWVRLDVDAMRDMFGADFDPTMVGFRDPSEILSVLQEVASDARRVGAEPQRGPQPSTTRPPSTWSGPRTAPAARPANGCGAWPPKRAEPPSPGNSGWTPPAQSGGSSSARSSPSGRIFPCP